MQAFENHLDQIITNQRAFFNSNKTKDVRFRINALKRFHDTILEHEQEINSAIYQDLHKSEAESYLTEISLVLGDIKYHIKHVKRWAKLKKVSTPLHVLPSKTRLLHEPLGISLIMAPWNYPFQLIMNSLVGAISSGCCAILKPAPETPKTMEVIKKIVAKAFSPEHVTVIEPSLEENEIVLKKRFDFIFFTGSPRVGKIVAEAAVKHLTPTVLELGGKSPCIVDATANISIAAKRIVFGKLINCGQTCIAPDYIYVHQSQKQKLIEELKKNIIEMYGEDVEKVGHYPRMIHARATERVSNLIDPKKVVYGGKFDIEKRLIHPTIIDGVTTDDGIMQEEIFGPLFPILTYNNIQDVVEYIKSNEKPLAFYYFGNENKGLQIFNQTSSGGGCINDTLMHITNHKVPFGGVGNSGMGGYHGYYSFEAFSNKRAIVVTPTWIDLPLKYAPFKYINLIKKIM